MSLINDIINHIKQHGPSSAPNLSAALRKGQPNVNQSLKKLVGNRLLLKDTNRRPAIYSLPTNPSVVAANATAPQVASTLTPASLKNLIERSISHFADLLKWGYVGPYNEFSLQHELGLFLRGHPAFVGRKIQFERNVSYFTASRQAPAPTWTKREIDISIFEDAAHPELAIELKYPRNGQYPEAMFSFCKDIRFLEELRDQAGFKCGMLFVLVDEPSFYSGPARGIYSFFRGNAQLRGNIKKPTGSSGTSVTLDGSYQVDWQTIDGGTRRYFVVTV